MSYYETGESSKSAEGRKSREKDKSIDARDKDDESHDKHKQKHHHRREKSKHDLEKNKAKDEETEEKRDKSLKREKSKSREQLKRNEREDEDNDKDREVEKDRKSSRSMNRTNSKRSERTDSSKNLRRASEMPISMDHESTEFIKEFARNMVVHHKSEPDLRPFVEEAQAKEKKKSSEGRSSKQKKVHPAIALIKSAISSRLAAIAKDRQEKQKVRETSHRLRRHTVTEAATLFNYEPREPTPTTPTSTPSATPTYTPVPASAPPPTPITDPSPAESPETIPDSDNDSDREYSPDMVIQKSYTPDLMRYADVDLAPHLSVSVGVVRTTSFWEKVKRKVSSSKK